MIPTGDFDRDTRVTAVDGSAGRFQGEISEAWRALSAAGGVVTALAHRAAQCAVDRPAFAPVFLSASFCSPVPCERVEVDASVLATTQNTAHAMAKLYARGSERPKMYLTAIFARRHRSPHRLSESRFPEGVLPPADAIPFTEQDGPHGSLPITRQIEIRWAHEFVGRPGRRRADLQRPSTPEPAVVKSWLRFRRAPRLPDGTLDPLALAVPADAIAAALSRGLGTSDLPFLPVTLSMDLHFVGTTKGDWLLQHVRVSRLADGYASGIVEIWDEDRNLIAVSTQLRVCKPLDTRE